jgi:hypothetical protein
MVKGDPREGSSKPLGQKLLAASAHPPAARVPDAARGYPAGTRRPREEIRSRSLPCAFCGLRPGTQSYNMPQLEVRGSQGNLLEWQADGPWPVCSDCDAFVGGRDELGLSGRVVSLLANRAGRPLWAHEAEHVQARHRDFMAALPDRSSKEEV